MDKHPPIRLVDNNDRLRLALARKLRGKGHALVALRDDEQSHSGTDRIFIEIPSDLTLLEPLTDYITTRVNQLWSVPVDGSIDLALALREALVNAIEHGNQSIRSKVVLITAEVLADEARFTVEDEGPGFNVNEIPHPRQPENLFKSSGRGVLLIRSIMDEVRYNDRGNRLTMIKRRSSLLGGES